jgi:hypothetical protein
VIYSISCISAYFGHFYSHHQESWLHLNYCIWFQHWLLLVVVLECVVWSAPSPQCTQLTTHSPRLHPTVASVKPCAVIQVQSTLLTMVVKIPETCWDTNDWINHYLLHLVGLAFDYLPAFSTVSLVCQTPWCWSDGIIQTSAGMTVSLLHPVLDHVKIFASFTLCFAAEYCDCV